MDYTKKLLNKVKRLRLSVMDLAFCELVAAGWEPNDAYMAAYHKGATMDDAYLSSVVSELLGKNEIMAQIGQSKDDKKARKTQKAKEKIEDEGFSVDNVSKEKMLRELFEAKEGMDIGSKEWLDTQKMIADITRMKQDEVKTEDTTIHYFLPLKCPECPLFIKNGGKIKANE